MKELKKTGKQIVSKGAYVKTVIERTSFMVGGSALYIVVLFMAMATILFGGLSIIALVMSILCGNAGVILVSLILLIISLLLGATTYALGKLSIFSIERSEKLANIIPLTRATIAEVPVFEILVRASQEPVQSQETTLLRPAIEEQALHEEQLLRAFASEMVD